MRPHRSQEFLDPDQGPSRTGTRLGAVLGASAAALVSAGLVYWIGSSHDPTLKHVVQAPRAYAAPAADAGEVVRAYDRLQEVYADGGAAGVAGFSRGCAQSLASDPVALDFCVAFDIYAAALIGDGEQARAWRASADERDLALARAALPPTEDPVLRLAQIRELARQTSLHTPDLAAYARKAQAPRRAQPHHARRVAKPAAAPTATAPAAATSAAATPADAPAKPADDRSGQPAARPAQPAEAKPAEAKLPEVRPRARPATMRKASVRARPPGAPQTCRSKATAGERTVCASPALREADVQLQSAYRKAVAAGANPQQLARDQARFRRAVNAAAPDRVAVERLYYQRTRTLEALSQSP